MCKVTLKQWIKSKFGDRGVAEAARFLGYPYKTVLAWVKLDRFPRPATQEIITLKSDGQVDVNQWRTDYLKAEQARKAKA